MEIQLQELIDQIKKEGVDAAQTEADAIIDNARAEAQRIIARAEAEAQKLLKDAKAENERMVRSSEDAIRQAGRNLLLSFRESVARELKAVTAEGVGTVYSSDAVTALIVKCIENWAAKPDADDLTVIMSPADLERLEKSLLSALKAKLQKGITLRANDNFDGGFRIAVNGGSVYYDYSAEAVVDMLSAYLSPVVTKLLKEAQ